MNIHERRVKQHLKKKNHILDFIYSVVAYIKIYSVCLWITSKLFALFANIQVIYIICIVDGA